MYECFNCGHRSVYWQADFDFEDYGLEGDGIIHVCHCDNCGADVEYYVPGLKKDPTPWNEWVEDDTRLEDHYFYLVVDKEYGTPMKAKYHDDVPHFEIYGATKSNLVRECVYFFENRITHWMPLPPTPKTDPTLGEKNEL